MDEATKKQQAEELNKIQQDFAPQPETEVDPEPKEATVEEGPDPTEELKAQLKDQQDKYLRLAAEYDNYRKRTQKEKDNIYRDATAAAVEKFLPVYDNLSLALAQETEDAAYKKGVEMTMNGLQDILTKLNVTVFGEAGDDFDPELHNAVMHIEDENYGEGKVVQVFQKGFRLGDKVVRFAMVQTAN